MGFGFGPGPLARLGAAVSVALLATTTTGVLHTVGAGQEPVRAASVPDDRSDPVLLDLANRSGIRSSILAQVDPETILGRSLASSKRKVEVTGPKGTRIWSASALAEHDLPAAALRAYKNAAQAMARTDPSCQLPWTLLAGIGRVESDQGRYGGAVLASDGVSHPLILGVPLNGAGPVAAIHDTDNGRYDKDTVWDRAVGPMQFIPSTWVRYARDGDGNGVMSPNDIDDAALAAAAYLCAGSGSVNNDAGMRAAIYSYNQSDYYVALVMAFERGYRTGVFVIPSPPPPDHPKKHHKHDKAHKHHKHQSKAGKDAATAGKDPTKKPSGASTGGADQTSPGGSTSPVSQPTPKPSPSVSPSPSPDPSPSPSPSSSPTSTPSSPSPSPKSAQSAGPSTKPAQSLSPSTTSGPSSPSPSESSPTRSPSESSPSSSNPSSSSPSSSSPPSPSQSRPELVSLAGALTACDAGWCIGGTPLDLGPADQLAATAAADYDGSGSTGTNAEELAGLEGQDVSLLVVEGPTGTAVVYTIDGTDYRLADGSFA